MSLATVKLRSRVLYMPTDISVLLPDPGRNETYGIGKKYKVLWLLHGAGNDHTEWLYGTKLTSYMRGRDTVVVMPTALNSDYGCYPDFGRGYDFPSFFFDELMPFIRGSFPVSDKPEDSFIAGASMGGFGALELGLLRPEEFGGIGAFGCSPRESEFLEPYKALTGAEFRKIAMKDPHTFRTEYGDPSEGIKQKEINVIAKYPTVQDFLDSPECMFRRFPEVVRSGKLPKMYITVGKKDQFYEPTARFKALADELGADNIVWEFYEEYGHSGKLWDLSLCRMLELFGL